MRTCEFNISTSVRPDYNPKFCNDKAEFQHAGSDYCRMHWVIESYRILVCQTCENPISESYRAISSDHAQTCRLWNQGVDCMCLEYVNVCRCEENARIVDELQS